MEIVKRIVGNKTYVLAELSTVTSKEIRENVEDHIKNVLEDAITKIDEVASLLQVDIEDMFATGSQFDEYQDLASVIDDGRDNLMESLGIEIGEPMSVSSVDIGIKGYLRNNQIKFYKVVVKSLA